MSTSKLNLFPEVNSYKDATTASATGIFPPNFLNRKFAENQQTTGLLSGQAFAWAAPKPRPRIRDALLSLIFATLSRFISIIGRFIPSFVWSFLMLSIPPLIAFYEIKVRRYFPKLPPVFKIVSMFYQHGLLTIETVTWLVSRLPQGIIGGLGVAGGLAIHGTSAIASGATVAGNALVGGAVSVAGNAAKTVTQGINHINPGAVATDIAQIVSGGQRVVAGAATKGVADIISLHEKGQTVVTSNLAQLVSGQQGIAESGPLIPDIAKDAIQAAVGSTNAVAAAAIQSVTNPAAAIGATHAVVTEKVTKLASGLEGVNPLPVSILPNAFQDSRVSIPRLRAF
ncbi:hypothetical protein BJV78DRAFT_817573 [Lactifluus subvellereus]|nr:hypothetical protein BJV78DRAFT_817573 [Lactifluus subvellereus]